MDLGEVGASLEQAAAEGVTAAVRAQAFEFEDADVDAEDDLNDAGDGERAALGEPGLPGLAAALVQPGRDRVPCTLGQRDITELVAFAVQAYFTGAGSEREVLYLEAGAFFL